MKTATAPELRALIAGAGEKASCRIKSRFFVRHCDVISFRLLSFVSLAGLTTEGEGIKEENISGEGRQV